MSIAYDHPKVTLLKDLPGIQAPCEGEWVGDECWFPNAGDPFSLPYMQHYPDFFMIDYGLERDSLPDRSRKG